MDQVKKRNAKEGKPGLHLSKLSGKKRVCQEFMREMQAQDLEGSWIDRKKHQFMKLNLDIEQERFYGNSKEAFNKLKKVYKYDQFEKRDGSLITTLRDGEVLQTESKTVGGILLK